jgi:hypothetical protein
MSDLADKPSVQSPIAPLAERQVVQFISDALRAGQRAILVTGRGQVSIRVPEAALAACVSTSARVLHIGPPLPKPLGLQEMIGAAAGIAVGRRMTQQAMARLLLTADPRRTVILAIDDAHTLPQRSLSYLALMTDLPTMGAPILQIVLAAGPAILGTLAQPEFETLRNRLSRPGFATFQNCFADAGELTKPSQTRTSAAMVAPQLVWHPPRVPTRWRLRRGIGGIAPKVYAAVGILAMSLAAIGYFAFLAFTDGSTPSLKSAALQKFLAPSDQSQSPVQLDLRQTDKAIDALIDEVQTDKAIDALIDEVVDAVAMGSVGSVSALLQRIATLEASASPDGLKLLVAMPDRFAARASAAVADGRGDEARRLEQVYRTLRGLEASSGSAPQSLPETAPALPSTPDQPPPKTDQRQWEGINCPPRDTFKNAQAWVHERLNCERHSTPNEPWIEWAEYCPSDPLGYFVLKVKTGQQKVYLFENITPAFWEGFKAAPAAGKFYHRELKGKRHWFRLASELKPSTCHR